MAELAGRLLRRVSTKRHYQGLGIAARDLLRAKVLPGKVAKRLQLLDTAYSVCRHITMACADALYEEVNACCLEHERTSYDGPKRIEDEPKQCEETLHVPKIVAPTRSAVTAVTDESIKEVASTCSNITTSCLSHAAVTDDSIQEVAQTHNNISKEKHETSFFQQGERGDV